MSILNPMKCAAILKKTEPPQILTMRKNHFRSVKFSEMIETKTNYIHVKDELCRPHEKPVRWPFWDLAFFLDFSILLMLKTFKYLKNRLIKFKFYYAYIISIE